MAWREDETTREVEESAELGRFGPYHLIRLIERGGMGEVFEAEAEEDTGDVRRGERVALKRLLPSRVDDDEARRRFRREVELGRALRHPALVPILDSGTFLDRWGELRDCFAMEYVEGRSLAAILEDGSPLPEAQLRKLALQLAGALDALHQAGVVHRDVKPGNVLVTATHDVKLADLGIAHLASPELRMTSTRAFLGTFYYAAPEQFDHEPVVPSSDLYSLGVLLYEAATGQCPFRAPSYLEVAKLHHDYSPPRVCRLRQQLSSFFEDVVTTLMQKQPKHRFSSARELLQIMEEAEASPWWQERAAPLDSTGQGEVARRLRLRVRADELFVGRQGELELLRSAEEAIHGGSGRAILIEGEAGLGKTRLLAEFVAQPAERLSALLLGGFRASGGSHEPEGLLEALQCSIGLPRRSSELARYLPDAPWQAALLDSHLRGEPPAVEDGHSPLAALQAAARGLLRSMAREQPLVLMIEDIHHAGEARAPFLVPLLELVATEQVLLILTRRPTTHRRDPLSEAIARGQIDKIELGKLGRDEVESLLAALLESRSLAAENALRVSRRTGGNPFFVVAVARDMKNRAAKDEPGAREARLPASLRDLLLERVKELDSEDASLLRAAAVLGASFDPFELAAVVRRDALELVQALETLERAGGLVRSVGAAFEFEHALLREAVEAGLSEAMRQSLHGRVAEVHLQSRATQPSGREPGPTAEAHFLAHHLIHSRHPEQGLPWVSAALEYLHRANRSDELLALSSRALELAEGGDERLRARIRLHQANCLELLGRLDAHQVSAQDALALATACGDEQLQLRAFAHLAHALEQRGDHAAALAICDSWLERATALGEKLPLALARAALGRLRRLAGRGAEARELLESSIALAREAGNAAVQARSLVILGQVQLERGELLAAREDFRRARALARGAADPRTEASALGNLARAHLRLGDFDAAETLCREHVDLSRELGFRQGRLVSSLNLAALHLTRGEYSRVRELAAEVIELDDSAGGFHGDVARLLLADVELAEGRLPRAIERAEEVRRRRRPPTPFMTRQLEDFDLELALLEARVEDARRILEGASDPGPSALDDPEDRVRSLVSSATLAACLGDEHRREELVDQALDLARELGAEQGLAMALVDKGRIHFERGEAELAAPYLREAADIVARRRFAVPGPIPAAFLALLRESEPARVQVSEGCPVLVRAEAHLLLHRAGGEWDALPKAKLLLDTLCVHLAEEDRQRFWRTLPIARAVLAESQAASA